MLDKYNKTWNLIKNKLNIKFYCMPVYDKTYIKAKVREFDGKIKTTFIYYTCTACTTIDSVMKMGKKLFSFLFIRYWF